MIQKTVRINNKYGLHARPSALVVRLATKFRSDFFIQRDELKVNGKSIMGVMMLAAEQGALLTIIADGVDETYLIDEMSKLIESDFGE